MLNIKTKIDISHIHGIGVFTEEFIPKGTILWKFTQGFDQRFTEEQILNFPKLIQIYLCKYSWRGVKSGLYCMCSDNGKYFNHSIDSNCLSSYVDTDEEVVTTALRDIQAGEELTDNYASFESDFDNSILENLAKEYHLVDELDPRSKVLSGELNDHAH